MDARLDPAPRLPDRVPREFSTDESREGALTFRPTDPELCHSGGERAIRVAVVVVANEMVLIPVTVPMVPTVPTHRRVSASRAAAAPTRARRGNDDVCTSRSRSRPEAWDDGSSSLSDRRGTLVVVSYA
jgi:hypothetical protein